MPRERFLGVDYTLVIPETRLVTDVLMFIGAGSGSTAGGIKVTTLLILILAARAVIRGERDVNVLDRRVPDSAVRVAIAVTISMAAAVVIGTVALESLTSLGLDRALFEVPGGLL